MNAWGFFASVVASLAWPTAVVLLAYAGKGQLTSLVSRLARVKYKDFEAGFSSGLERLERDVSRESAERRPIATNTRRPEEETTFTDRFDQLADLSPAAAVVEASLNVESALRTMAPHHGISARRGGSALYLTRMLQQKGAIDSSTVALLEQLRALRNQAAHGGGVEITREDATRYRELADEVARILYASAD